MGDLSRHHVGAGSGRQLPVTDGRKRPILLKKSRRDLCP
jgi:hypothetical protein